VTPSRRSNQLEFARAHGPIQRDDTHLVANDEVERRAAALS
jgi:hypothetical protein